MPCFSYLTFMFILSPTTEISVTLSLGRLMTHQTIIQAAFLFWEGLSATPRQQMLSLHVLDLHKNQNFVFGLFFHLKLSTLVMKILKNKILSWIIRDKTFKFFPKKRKNLSIIKYNSCVLNCESFSQLCLSTYRCPFTVNERIFLILLTRD